MARNFYFGADATMVSGSVAFAAAIDADPSAFGLTEAQSLAYQAIDAALQDAYQAAITPATRSPVAIAKKNEAIKAMQRTAGPLAKIIMATPTVTDAQLLSLGLLPRPNRTRRNVPANAPSVQVLSVTGRLVTIRICDKDSPSRRSKPFGARGAELFSYVGEESPTNPRDYHFEGYTSRTTMQVIFPNNVSSGATVWLSARWVSARGETSIASVPMSFTLQGGAVGAATLSLAA